VVTGILWDCLEKSIQSSGHLVYRSPIFLALILLLKNKSGEVRAQQFRGRFVELFGENLGVQIGFIFNVLVASVDFLSSDYLWHFEYKAISGF
jgi:hypothetical protein